jgi:outer membrane protein
MNFQLKIAFCSLLAVVAGCNAVHRASEAKKTVENKALGVADAYVKFDLEDYSLRELVEFAMTNRPSVEAASLAVEESRTAMRQLEADAPLVSATPWNAPKISASVGRGESSRSTRHLDGDTHGNASGALSLNLLVYDFGRHEARVAAQIESVLASELALIQEGYKVFEEVATAYFSLKERDAQLEAALTNEFEYGIHCDKVESRLKVGEAKSLDLMRARLDLAEARERTVAASNEVVVALAELKRSLGIDASRFDRDEVFKKDDNALGSLSRAFVSTTFDSSWAMDFARTNSPELAIARARLRASASEVDLAVADVMPNINASLSLNWTDPLWYWQWASSAAQSIYQGGGKIANIDSSVLKMQNAASKVDEIEQQLASRMELAVAERDDAALARATALASLKEAKDNLALVSSEYEVGQASRVDYTTAVAAYSASLGKKVSAFYRAQAAEARLFALMGRMPEYREEKLEESK